MEWIVNGPIFAQKACEFVNLASQFNEEILVSAKKRTVDAKSLLGVLSLALVEGDRMLLTAHPDTLSAFSNSLKQSELIQAPFHLS